MTRPDQGPSNKEQGQPNPFDTGLPMLRLPAPPTGKRRRRRPAGRRPGSSYSAPLRTPEPPRIPEPPHVSGLPQVSGPPRTPEEAYPLEPPAAPPVRKPPRRMGEWAEWLDPPTRAEELPEQPTVEIRVPVDDEPEPDRRVDDSKPFVPAIIDRTGGNPGPALRRPRPRPQEQQPERGNKILAVLIVVGLLVGVGSIIWAVLPSSGTRTVTAPTSSVSAADDAPAPASPTPTGPDSPTAVATPGCEQRRTGDVVSGTGIGGTTDGPSAILAFERAYYVQRSGPAARAVVAADATVPPAEQIQRGIDQVPVGTRYCVQITRTAVGAGDGQSHWEVRLTQQYPGQQPKVFTQIITTKTVTGRTLITGISMA